MEERPPHGLHGHRRDSGGVRRGLPLTRGLDPGSPFGLSHTALARGLGALLQFGDDSSLGSPAFLAEVFRGLSFFWGG